MDEHNTSGQGPDSQVPPEIRGWNWGAFLLNWIWGIPNQVLLALLVFVPFFGLVWVFVIGAKGSEWAWRNRRWDSVAQFQATQRRWTRWGLGLLAVSLVLAGLFVVGIAGLLKDSEAYRLAQARLDGDERVVALLGRPISTGWPSGQFRTSGPRGSASLAFSAEGPQGRGQVFVEASRDMGQWKIDRMVFEDEASGRRIDLAPPPAAALSEGAT